MTDLKRLDYSAQAEELFERFAQRHCLEYVIEVESKQEVLWSFPAQPKLEFPLTLGLQNCDELNFGVADFWSYFFPFENVKDSFDAILDAWVLGTARIALVGWSGRLLQLQNEDDWQTVYRANGFLTSFRKPSRYIQNHLIATDIK